ncbi:MAG: hypothetical protein PWP24_545 [Clostridiales bacterium]|nr:hypothetical protein [Clostridiales bacterium]
MPRIVSMEGGGFVKSSEQVSESFTLGAILALSGGFMDAYTYLFRGHVFANAQTGNIILCGLHLQEGNFLLAMRYLFPIVSFTLGIILAELLCHQKSEKRSLHWNQSAVLIEAGTLLIVSMLSTHYNLVANSLVSFACGIQVESFRKIRGNGIATTMCIGNLRTGTQNLCDWLRVGDKKYFETSMVSYGIILFFAVGAILGDFFVQRYHEKAILFSCVILLLAFLKMHGEKRRK